MWAEGISRWQTGGQSRGLSPDEVAMWKTAIPDLRIFPTTQRTWCSIGEGVYINDDTELARPFMEAANAGAAFFPVL
jgi:hypothetical protein